MEINMPIKDGKILYVQGNVLCINSKPTKHIHRRHYKLISKFNVGLKTLGEAAIWPITFLIDMLTALKGSQFDFYLLLLQLVLCRVAALKSLPVHHSYCRLYFHFGPLRSARVF